MNHALVILCLLGIHCTPTSSTRETDTSQVRRVAVGIIAADNNRDIGQVLSFYSAYAVLLPPNEPPVVGIESIRPRYETLFELYNPAIETEIEEIVRLGGLAYVWGRNEGWLHGRNGLTDRSLSDEYLMILHRDPSDQWKISRLMWHSSEPDSTA